MTRQEAIQAGKKRFYTGRPCRNGHFAERYTSNNSCVRCMHPKAAQRHGEVHGLHMYPMKIAISTEDASDFHLLRFMEQYLHSQVNEARKWALEEKARLSAGVTTFGARIELTEKAAPHTLEYFREAGWTDNALVYNGFARLIPPKLKCTALAQNTTLEKFFEAGWTAEQLLARGFAVIDQS